jgi:uncharacterized DUF497 family protein
MFDGDVLALLANRLDYDEERWVAVGLLNGTEITVVYIDDDDLRHLISARRATKDERKDFWEGARRVRQTGHASRP